jgi:hypothetical protein
MQPFSIYMPIYKTLRGKEGNQNEPNEIPRTVSPGPIELDGEHH